MKKTEYRHINIRNISEEWILLLVSVVLLWSAVLVSKKIYPFGDQYLMMGDGFEQILPAYTHTWDFLHGQKSLLFDWYTGLGNNMAGMVHEFALVSPFNLFFLLVKRSSLEAAMSVFILIKLIAIAFSMKFLLKHWFGNVSSGMSALFCILYAFSPFNMEYYYVSRWSEMSFMFPLLMYGYFQLMNEGKKVVYIICLAITTMLSFQNIYMLVVMLLLLTGLLPLLDIKYKKRLWTLLIATLIGLLISSWLWVPASIQIMKSNRATYMNSIKDIWLSIWIFHTGKWMKLWNMSIPLSCYLLYSWKNWRRKSVRFFSIILLFLCAPIILESTNLLWHGGSYMGYTMRFSYMLAFWIITGGAFAYNHNVNVKNKLMGGTIVGLLITTVNIACAGLLCYFYINDATVMNKESAVLPVIVLILFTVCLDLILLCQNDKMYKRLVWMIVLAQTFSLELISIYAHGDVDNTYIAVSNRVLEDSGEELSPVTRIKADASMNHNYPFVMRKNAASNFQPFNSEEQMEGMLDRGYAYVGVKMSDYGGTLISDALMGVKYAIAKGQVNESLYEQEKKYGDYTLYNSLYYYEQGIKLMNPDMESEQIENPFDYQNRLAETIVGVPLLDIFTGSGDELSLQIKDESVLYLFSDYSKAFTLVSVKDRNSGEVYELDLSGVDWENEILELGVWENTSLMIDIVSDEPIGEVSCATLSLEMFRSHIPEVYDEFDIRKDRMSLGVFLKGAAEGEYLYLPIYPDDGWKCVVNGERVTIGKYGKIGMAIPLRKGDNNIELSFVPPGLPWGIAVSVIGLIAFGIILILNKGNEYKAINQVLFIGDEMIFTAIILVFYIIPVICLVIWGVSAIVP